MLCRGCKRVLAFGGVFKDPLTGLHGADSTLTADKRPVTLQQPSDQDHKRRMDGGALLHKSSATPLPPVFLPGAMGRSS